MSRFTKSTTTKSSSSTKIAAKVNKVLKAKAKGTTRKITLSSLAISEALETAKLLANFRYGSGNAIETPTSVKGVIVPYPLFSSPIRLEYPQAEGPSAVLPTFVEYIADVDSLIESIGSPKAEVVHLAADRDYEVGHLPISTGWGPRTWAARVKALFPTAHTPPKRRNATISPNHTVRYVNSFLSASEDEEYVLPTLYSRDDPTITLTMTRTIPRSNDTCGNIIMLVVWLVFVLTLVFIWGVLPFFRRH